MSFFHAPTEISLAIGATVTLLDLAISQHLASRKMFEEFEDVRLVGGGTLLDGLERAGLVKVQRDGFGQLERVTRRASLHDIFSGVLDLYRRDLQCRVPGPLSNMRLKLAAPFFYGGRPFVPSRN